MGIELIVTTWLLGLVSGVRHAFEPDHVAAVSTLVAGGHGSRRATWLGVWWGLGHTVALLAGGLVLVVLRAELPSAASEVAEFGVAVMLVALGVRAIRHAYNHVAGAPHVHVASSVDLKRSFGIGIIHGLAGSGVISALVMSQLSTLPAQLVYVALFGLGSTAAMAAVSGVAGWQLARLGNWQRTRVPFQWAAGVLSLVVGLAWGYPFASRMLWPLAQ